LTPCNSPGLFLPPAGAASDPLNSVLCSRGFHEKYNVVTASSDVQVATGYRTNVVGFGWTNAVYLKMQDLLLGAGLSRPAATEPPRPCPLH
jgi:alpha,alpha-trehalase